MDEEPRGPRRAMPDSFDDERLSNDDERHASPDRARRALPDEASAQPDETDTPPIDRRGIIAVIVAIVLVIAVVGAYLFFGTRKAAKPAPVPQPSASMSPSPPAPSPSPTQEPPGVEEIVGDATITLPRNWEVYHDELTEGNRRLIRAKDPTGNVRIQVATLTSVDADIAAACELLVADQSADYTVDFRIEPRPVAVSGNAHAVVCGYVGAKEQGGATSVRFTLIRRDSDEHTLVVRMTRPQPSEASDDALTEAAAMTCEASHSFNHPLALC
ncbi:hypothetical protein [uncultured Tessaracoccus sp.]|uniref:hypothetical protein n=1 Tax=uncultured Tessaracoccus sp. TaxID=905023 RepID=UPI00263607F4|nr:hypothetical protein [uncultured Tessaracoccus sp.]